MSRHEEIGVTAWRLALPVLRALATGVLLASHVSPAAAEWSNELGDGADGDVFALQAWQGGLVAGGRFHAMDGEDVPVLAMFDGLGWTRLGNPLYGGYVLALGEYQGDLIVGGDFAFADPQAMLSRSIAAYDGSTFFGLAGGVHEGRVLALREFEGTLVVAGSFSHVGGTDSGVGSLPAHALAQWDGQQWRTVLGLGSSTVEVRAVAVHDGSLYAGGLALDHDDDPATPAHAILRWDAGARTWHPLAGGLRYDDAVQATAVFALASFAGELYVGGQFSHFDNGDAVPVESRYVARFDGARWRTLGSRALEGGAYPTAVRAFAEYAGQLAVAGGFLKIGDESTNRMAFWNASTEAWTPAPNGVPGPLSDVVYAVAPYGADGLALGGAFGSFRISMDPEIFVRHLVLWEGGLPARQGPVVFTLGMAYPNPFNPRTSVPFTLARSGFVRLSIHDARGRLVTTLVEEPRSAGTYRAIWDGRDSRGSPVASGVYLGRLEAHGKTVGRKLVLQR